MHMCNSGLSPFPVIHITKVIEEIWIVSGIVGCYILIWISDTYVYIVPF